MTPQTAATKVKLEVDWTAGESFDVPCQQLAAQEPRVLKNFTILITPCSEPVPTSLAS